MLSPEQGGLCLKRGFILSTWNFRTSLAAQKWNDLHSVLTNEHGFAEKPALIGLSCGGLYCYQWAIENPQKVACLYGDAPVSDMRSWPRGKGDGFDSPDDWKKLMKAFGFASEAEAIAYNGNPIDNLTPWLKPTSQSYTSMVMRMMLSYGNRILAFWLRGIDKWAAISPSLGNRGVIIIRMA